MWSLIGRFIYCVLWFGYLKGTHSDLFKNYLVLLRILDFSFTLNKFFLIIKITVEC
jgi:hypothetical protein